LGVTNVLGLALASGRALPLEGPDKADVLVGMPGDGDILSFHHVGDVGKLEFPEAFEDSSVGVGVEHCGRSGLLAWHSVWVCSIGSAWRHFQHVVPLRRKFAQTGHKEEQDCIDDLVKLGGSRTVSGPILSSGPGGPAKVVLLGFVEDAIEPIHPCGRDGGLGEDDMEPRPDSLDKGSHVGGHGMGIA
jgi:hypothetical protein